MSIPNDTSLDAERVQIELLRKAGVAGRLRHMLSLSHSVLALSKRALTRQHPDADCRENGLRFVAIHYGPELEKNVRDYLARRSTQ